MCRIVPEKNLHHLIQAYTRLKEQGKIKDVKLVIAGDSDFEDDYSIRLKKMAKDNGIIMTGFVKGKKLQSLLTHAGCYVLPSSHEGLPIGLLEAMSYHLPVIVSDIPAHQELNLCKNCYFQVGNIEDLTRVLHANITTDFKSVEYDMKKYNWDNIADDVCKVYQLCYENNKKS